MKDMNKFNKAHHVKTEVLAPAGTYSSLMAAFKAGADAVYLGGDRFGARAYAGNFNHDELIKAIHTAHIFGKKIYMTVNTLLFENEINDLVPWMKNFYEEGLDGVIVQDMGVLNVLHSEFPDMELHASTQMTVMTGDSTKILHDKYGVTRIVPGRELDINDLKTLRSSTDLDIEVFIHGALCYSVSGQCMLSRMRGRRSGNRGSCAGSCRLLYSIENRGDLKYILSTKENCGLFYLGELIHMGTDSVKIEGRMKKPEYVAFITSVYRKYTDLFMEKGYQKYNEYIYENSEEIKKDIFNMADIYNRNGFTDAFFSISGVSPEFSTENGIHGLFKEDTENNRNLLLKEEKGNKGKKVQMSESRLSENPAESCRSMQSESSLQAESFQRYESCPQAESRLQYESPMQSRGSLFQEDHLQQEPHTFPDRFMLSEKRPRHGGICTGIVTGTDKRNHTFTYKCINSLNDHDVVEVRDREGHAVYEYTLKNAAPAGARLTARYKSGCEIRKGDLVFRTRNNALIEKIREKFIESELRAPVCMEFYGKEGENLILNAWRPSGDMPEGACGIENEKIKGKEKEKEKKKESGVTVTSPEPVKKAEKAGAERERIIKILSQTGGTVWNPVKINVHIDEGLFIPVSVLKSMRRKALSELEEKIIKSSRRSCRQKALLNRHTFSEIKSGNNIITPGVLSVRVINQEQFEAALSSEKVTDIFIRPEIMEPADMIKNAGKSRERSKRIYLVMPRLLKPSTKKIFLNLFREVISENIFDGFLACTFDEAEFIKNTFNVKSDRIILDGTVYAVNSMAFRLYAECGYRNFITSYEEDPEQIMMLPESARKMITGAAAGPVPVMVSDICVYENLYGCGRKNGYNTVNLRSLDRPEFSSDRLKAESLCRFCYNEISMEDPVKMNQRIMDLKSAGIERFMVNLAGSDRTHSEIIIKKAAAEIFN